VNEEQRKQRDARVAELAEAAVEWSGVGGNLTRSEIADMEAQIRSRINLALDEQAIEIAAAIRQEGDDRGGWGDAAPGYYQAAKIAAGFGDDR
jgi:hypothetical protein